MKALMITLIIGAVILGLSEGDCTAAVVLAMLLLPAICDSKKVKKNVEREQR